MYSACYTCTIRLRFRAVAAEEVYFVYYTCTIVFFQLELRKCTSRTTLVLQSCIFPAGAAEVYFAYHSFTTKLRLSSWICGEYTSFTTLVLQSCDFPAGAAERKTLVLQSFDFPSGAAEVYFAYYTCTTKFRFSSWSCGSILHALRFRWKAAISSWRYFAYYACTTKLRFSSWSCGGVLRVLHVYYKVAIFQLELRKCTSRTTLVL